MESRRVRGHRDMPFGVTASFGVGSYPEQANKDELFAAADEALYAAKAAGKNRVRAAARPAVRP